MYEDQTPQAILTRMLSKVDSSLDTREGSVVWDLLNPSTYEIYNLYQALEYLFKMGFANTATGVFLDLRAAEVGIYRLPSVVSNGTLTFSGNIGQVIPKGTVCNTSDASALSFTTTADATITTGSNGQGSVDAPAECNVGGILGNVAVGTITVVTGNLSGVLRVTNASAFAGGVDAESDTALLSRYYQKVQLPATSGNANEYVQWVRSVAGVGDCKVFPLAYGNGTVRIAVIDGNGSPATSSLVTSVQAYVDSVRPVGASVTVEAAKSLTINFTGTLVLDTGVDKPSVMTQVNSAIADYFKTLAFKDTTVRISHVAFTILNIPGVVDLTGFNMNGGSGNIILAGDTVPILGSVTI
jgi:uncharacterized phage protein gp47/JayE